MIPIDAFLRALMRDVAWGFFYGTVNFDQVTGTINHYEQDHDLRTGWEGGRARGFLRRVPVSHKAPKSCWYKGQQR